jgi:hypothetical protein
MIFLEYKEETYFLPYVHDGSTGEEELSPSLHRGISGPLTLGDFGF